MVLIANLQYGWSSSSFRSTKLTVGRWHRASFGFGIFIALETWLTPIEGWIVDNLDARRGPKLVIAFFIRGGSHPALIVPKRGSTLSRR